MDGAGGRALSSYSVRAGCKVLPGESDEGAGRGDAGERDSSKLMYKEAGDVQASPYSLPPFLERPHLPFSSLVMSPIVHEDPLESEIQRGRERLTACPTTHPERGNACHDLATSLYRRWTLTPSTSLLDEAVTLHHEALALRPDGHPDHAASCNSLGIALRKRYEATGATPSLDESIKLHQEAIALHLGGHPDRAASCNNLATALWLRYQMTGGSDLLNEIIKLYQEAFALRPVGHPDRAQSCSNLAIALDNLYRETASSNLLDEIITLHREALALRPAGHPDRAISCNNLGAALTDLYLVTRCSHLLDEIITLHREALALRPAGHPVRASSCCNLAGALLARYQTTGSSDLLDETIKLYREGLALQPDGHPDRVIACSNLADALQKCYKVTGSSNLLDEAIKLGREGLALLPAGHPGRHYSCGNLATALQDRYQVTDISDLLDEIIKLRREALALRPHGHPDRAILCNGIADSLLTQYKKTKDVTAVDEALALARENAASASSSELWRALLILFLIHTEQALPHFSMSTATKYLLQASASFPSTIPEFMRQIQNCLDHIWLIHSAWTPGTILTLLEVYTNIIDRLSRMTGFAPDAVSQLTALISARSFGSDACVAALLSGRPRQAVELMEHAHGVIWTQALHLRDPQLQDVPQSLASELEALFRAVSVPITKRDLTPADHVIGYVSPEDLRDRQNSRIQTILTEVRSIPGLERFMLGRSYAQLREAARKHPVVVLVSARGHVYALIIRDSAQENPDPLRLELTSDRLALLRDTAAGVGLRNEGAPQDVDMQFGRAMHISKRKETTALSTLADLWHDVVKPVIDHLQLQVRIRVRFIFT
jgi:tetratricopeptide (TPR) repeat protein